MDATLEIILAAGAIEIEEIEVGEKSIWRQLKRYSI
jgi:hypothetical protein